MTPLISIVGKSGVGKTTLIEKLLAQFNARNVRVVVVKHHAHTSPVDVPGKDTFRFAEAGASVVIVSSPAEIARFERVPHELTLAEIAARVDDADLILTEGFKREVAPKLEVVRAELGAELIARADDLLAIATDCAITTNVPRFDLNDAAGIAEFICKRFMLTTDD
jgi:molybdopterin-guanine dinucleotide biosynthesis adapter protein